MENKKYIMVGASIITRDLFRNVLRPLNNYGFKPSGGFWASELINYRYTISDWFTYLSYDAISIARYKNLNDSIIFTLKDDAKIITMDTTDKVLELADKYPSYHHILGYHSELSDRNKIFDYEKLSQDYDGIYVNFNYFNNQFKTNVFDSFSANSLLLFNLDCIKEYQSAPIIFDLDNPYSLPYINEDKISTPTNIDNESNEHLILSQLSKEIFNNLMIQYDTHIFTDYDNFFSKVVENISTTMSIITKNESEKIQKIKQLLKSKNMQVREELIVQNIVLNELTQYLLQNQKRIELLPPVKVRKVKSYKL